MFFQHGDVLLHKVGEIPSDSQKTDETIVQYGEHTGHAHRLQGDGFTIFENPKTKERHLRVVTPTNLTHKEHQARTVPPGEYRIDIVKEYDHFKEEARQVID